MSDYLLGIGWGLLWIVLGGALRREASGQAPLGGCAW
jgi:hypothetical protein